MKKTYVLVGFALAGALAVACSSGPTTYTFTDAKCGPLPVTLGARSASIYGPCTLGSAGTYTFDAGLQINLGGCGNTPVEINADWIQGSSLIHSTFGGVANIGCKPNDGGTDFTVPITIAGAFLYDGGTGTFVNAYGEAAVDGGVGTTNGLSFDLNMNLTGFLTY